MSSATYAERTPGLVRLFDLRDTIRATDPPADDGAFVDLADTRLVAHPNADVVFVEQYRRLGAALHQVQQREGIRGVMVASAIAAEGKTLSATNLALTLSRTFKQRVLLVDGDLRKPAVHTLLEIENGAGLSDILKRPGGRVPAHVLSPTLSVITGGDHDPDPVALLVSDAARQFFAEAREQFDWVVVDTPPVVLFPDAGLFAAKLDTCIMVVGAATTASPIAAKAVTAIGASRILGAILNRAEPAEVASGYGYAQYGYAKRTDASRSFGWWRSRAR